MKPSLLAMTCAAACSVASVFALHGCAAGDLKDSNGSSPDGGCAGQACSGDAATSMSFGDASADGCKPSCSDDLTAVVDCQGNTLSTCPSGLACGASLQCMPPCEAAASLKSSLGCSYVVSPPMDEAEFAGSCYAVFVTNPRTQPVQLQARWGSQQLDMSSMARVATGSNPPTLQPLPASGLGPGQLAVLFLSNLAKQPSGADKFTTCPAGITAGVTNADVAAQGTALGQAFTITATGPVVAYDIWPYGGAASWVTSATLLLPVEAWDSPYVGLHAWANTQGLSTYLQVVASADTTLTLSPTADIAGTGGVQGGQAGQPYQTMLHAGQFLQLTGPDDAGRDFTGTIVSASVPVAVFAGNSALDLPTGTPYADTAHQQLVPAHSLGSAYVAARYANRTDQDEPGVYRIVGVVDGTQLTYDPPFPPGAYAPIASVDAGKVLTIPSDHDFVVRSQDGQHPFYMSGHMTGASYVTNTDSSNSEGDPDFVNLVTPAQFRHAYVFLTDPTYAFTNLVFVRQRTAAGFADVTLDCFGPVTGWTDVDTAGQFQVAKPFVARNGQSVGACGNGVHTATSSAPFGLTVWGWDHYVSYAYPAGMFVESVNSAPINPPK